MRNRSGLNPKRALRPNIHRSLDGDPKPFEAHVTTTESGSSDSRPQVPRLRVGPSKIHARGVFAICDVDPGETLEYGPLLVIPLDEHREGTLLLDYVFDLDGVNTALLLGLSSLCNHATDPNAEVFLDANTMTFTARASRPLHSGDEVLLDYGPLYWTKR